MKFGPTCSECPSPIGKASKSGRCKSCAMKLMHSDPEYSERRNAATREANRRPEARAQRRATAIARYSDPANRKAMSDACKAALAANPERAAWRKQHGADVLRAFHARGEFDWSAWHRERNAQAFAWLPEDKVEEYRSLRIKVGAEQAKAMILDGIARVERKRIAAMSPFERDMERLRNGAGLIAAPDFRTGSPDFTIGGVASGSL
jgi:hypothetical protein